MVMSRILCNVKLKYLAAPLSKYLSLGNVIQCRVLVVPINRPQRGRINYCNVVRNDQLQTVDPLLPKLCQWLECSKEKAAEICSRLQKRKRLHVATVEELISFLHENGITSSMLLDNPWMIIISLDELKARVHILRNVGLCVDTIPLLRLTSRHLAVVISQWLLEAETLSKKYKTANRLQFLADHLHCSCYDIAMQMDKHHILLTMDFERLVQIMHLLLDCGSIFRENIRDDLWIFRHNVELIHERIAIATKAGVHPIKTWMLRCPEITFKNMLENWFEMKDVLGNLKDRESYLAKRLNCSRMDITALAEKHKPVLTTKMPKVKLLLDFLFENGFTAQDILDSPRVFSSSISTLESRLRELKSLHYPYIHLWMLYATRNDYKRLIDKIQ